MPLGPPLQEEQHQLQARAQKSELRLRTDLMKDRDTLPSCESSFSLPGSLSGVGQGAGSSWGRGFAIREERVSKAHPTTTSHSHTLTEPRRNAPLCREAFAWPINVSIHLGFRQRQCFPRHLWAPFRTTSLPHGICQKLNCCLGGSWPQPLRPPIPCILIRFRLQTAGPRVLALKGSPWWTGRLGLEFQSEPASQTRAGPGWGSAVLPA